ncbi:hypothetical protein D3C81_1661950 [compost metagenome]
MKRKAACSPGVRKSSNWAWSAKSAKPLSKPWKPDCRISGRSSVSRRTVANICAVCCRTKHVSKVS